LTVIIAAFSITVIVRVSIKLNCVCVVKLNEKRPTVKTCIDPARQRNKQIYEWFMNIHIVYLIALQPSDYAGL